MLFLVSAISIRYIDYQLTIVWLNQNTHFIHVSSLRWHSMIGGSDL
jgi:hypothetical protein